MRIRLALVICALLCAAAAEAATLKVCASGCTYATLQPALDAASPGDTILLRAGETFVGPFVLRAKPASSSWITVRSDAADSLLPSNGVRLVPSGRAGANTSRALLARLIGQGGALKTTPVLRTASGASHYILKFLEIDGAANLGFETLIALGDDTATTNASDIVIDRVYAHGDAYKGMKRGISLNSIRTDILNSYISDVKAVNADSQAIAGYNGAGPFRIINNYLEAAGENVLFGGSDPAVLNLVPSNIELRQNLITKPLAWQSAILAPPGSVWAASSTSAGSLAAGTHYFKVVGVMNTDTVYALSGSSAEVSASQAVSGQSVTVSWSAVPGVDRYRIYRGTSSGGEAQYMETTGPVTSFTYTGTSEKSGAPASSGTKWTVKNIVELKNAQQVTIDGNVIEYIWAAGQYGYAVLLTPRNQSGGASWVRVRDVTISNNIIRHASGVLQLSGTDATHPSQQTQRIALRNNLCYDIDPNKWGGLAKVFLMGEAPAGVVLDHNTVVHTNSSVVYAYGTQTVTGFVYTNNISLHNTYGIMGDGGRPGQYTIDLFFPGSTITNNVLAGGPASAYPTPNSFPTVAQWNASFVNAAAANYQLLSSSVFYAAGAGGSVPGVNFTTLNAALAGNIATDPPPVVQPPSSNIAPISNPGGPYTGVKATLMTADGSGSSDADGTIAGYRWTWGDEIVVDAADTTATTIVGSRWARVSATGAAQGVALQNPDTGAAKVTSAAATPSSYVDIRFYAAAGVPYHVWFRMRAQGDSYTNDSMFVQFSGAVTATGTAVNRTNTTNAAVVILEEGQGAGISGWGWNDEAYGTLAAPVYFATSGLQTIRVQQREDGLMWDQLVVSAGKYLSTRPGLTRSDNTVIAAPGGSGIVSSHAYPAAGQYPVRLTVTDNGGAASTAATTATIK
ncbi:MAG: hypothetical protein V7647_1041 [Acidobacteriota bacterium]